MIRELSNISIVSGALIIFAIIFLVILDIAGLGLFFLFIKNFITNEPTLNYHLSSYLDVNSWDIKIFLLSLCMIYIFRFFLAILLNFIIAKFSLKQQYDLKLKLIKNLAKINIREIINLNKSKLLNIFSNHMNTFGNSLESYLRIVADLFLLTSIIIFLSFINFQIILIAVLLLGSAFFILKLLILQKIEKYGKIYNNSLNQQFIKIKDFFSGIQVLKLFNKENFFEKSISFNAFNVYSNSLKRNFLNSIPRQFFELIIILFIVISIGFLIIFYSKEKMISTIGIFIIALPRFIPTLNSLMVNLNNIRFGKAAVKEIYSLLILSRSSNSDKSIKVNDFEIIKLLNITYKTSKNSQKLFSFRELLIKKNDTIGLIGSSGSGKTTLINIIIGHINNFEGEIHINSQIYSGTKFYNLNNVALVPQENFIFEGSIAENITLENNSNNIDKKKLFNSIKVAQLKDFYDERPNKIISDNGGNISGGQKQRLNIARAFYFDKKFLIFDEPSSSLDQETEDDFASMLEELKNYFTIIIISHRPKLLSICTDVYKIENKTLCKV